LLNAYVLGRCDSFKPLGKLFRHFDYEVSHSDALLPLCRIVERSVARKSPATKPRRKEETSMRYVAQGTVQLGQQVDPKRTFALVNPIPDYAVRHRTGEGSLKKYVALAGNDQQTGFLVAVEESYEIHADLLDALRAAALRSVRIQVEVEKNGNSWKIVGILAPATPEPH
jgi:hypothetical protein